MGASEFMARFGGSCRTKHLLALPAGRRGLARFVWALLRGRTAVVNRRPYALPAVSELAREFIRLDPWEAEYLFLVASRARRGIVEIGRLRGGSTFLLACANPNVPIWSIDVDPLQDDTLRRLFDDHGVGGNVELLVRDSQRESFPELSGYDVLFVDGDHSYGGCSADLANHFPGLAPGGHVLLHDTYMLSVQQATLDFTESHEVETIRSPYTIASHWHTSYGSIAHLRKPGRSEPLPPPPAPVEPRRAERPVTRHIPVPTRAPSQRPLRRRRTRIAAAVMAGAFLVGLFGVAPEFLGDWPYNPWGKDSRAAHSHVRPHVQSLPEPSSPARL